MRCSRSPSESGPSRNSGERCGGVEPVGPVEPPARLGEGSEHEPVPGGDRLVVAERLRPLLSHCEERRPLVAGQRAAQHETSVLERLQQRFASRPDRGLELLLRPGERQALDAVGVRILRGSEAAGVQAQLPQRVFDRLLDDVPVPLLAGDEPGVQVRRDEQRVVVEHLLEVRHEPLLVDRVAVEAAADEVVHPARRHAVERAGCEIERTRTQEQLDRRRRRELRRVSEASPGRVVLRAQDADRVGNEARRERLARRRERRASLQRLDERRRVLRHLVRALPVRVGDRDQQLAERRQAVPRLRRVVRAAVERLALRREEDGHRPAALAGDRHHRVHVDRVDVRALLTVDLHAHEELVHQLSRLLVLERLALHHVTPVTGGVADREQDRLLLAPRAGEGLLAPRVPVDRVAGVLQQIRACLVGEAVHS